MQRAVGMRLGLCRSSAGLQAAQCSAAAICSAQPVCRRRQLLLQATRRQGPAASAHLPLRHVAAQVARPTGQAAAPGPDEGAIGGASSSSADQQPQQQQLQPESPSPAAAEALGADAASSPAPAPAAGSDAGGGSAPSAPATAGSGGGGGTRAAAGGGGGGAPSAVSLSGRFTGVGYTFVLAGFLKIVTLGGLAASAPVDTARTAFGKASPYLMVPVGLGLCWVAKQVVDSGLHESRRFLQIMTGVLLLLYFGLVKLLYRYAPGGEWVRRPKPRLPGPLADMRAELGDKDLLAGAGSLSDTRAYGPERPGREQLYDDVAWYEGRYPSQLGGPAGRTRGGGGGGGLGVPGRASARVLAAAASDTEEEYARGVEDLLRSRGGGGLEPDARGAAAAAAAASRPARRSFLSDNQR